MTSWDWIANILLGYFTVPLVSLAVRRHWPTVAKMALAIGFAVGMAFLQTWARHSPLTQENILAAFGVAFAAQLVTWKLELPGAGAPKLNEALLEVGSQAAASPPT